MDYDVAAAFEEIEADLIESMMRNLKRHRAEEDELGINWSQWQAEQLKALEEYKIRNAKKYGTKFNDINATLDGLIRKYREDGNTEQEVKILEAIKKGFKAEKAAPGVSAKFFKMNDRKIDALVRATTNDFKKAEAAILRRSNDQYRKIIFKAQMYAHMGGTYEKAVDMATKDFLRNGLKCVVYKNGSQHSLEDYADMALRTAQKRAYLTGEGEKRKEWGISTVIVNKRGNPCPLCAPWVGKVLVDDVWSGGSKDGKSNVTGVKYKTVSQAIAEGLYHPRCRDSHTTYFEGINTMPAEGYTKEELKELAENYKQEQKQKYAERQAESYGRLAEYSLDENSKRIYEARAREWEERALAVRKNKIYDIKTKESFVDDLDGLTKFPLNDNIDMGAYSGALNPESIQASKHAFKYYELVRKMTTDCERIANKTGYDISFVKEVKSHLFMTKHDLGNGELEYFFPDYEIAQSWQRLMDDNMKIQPHDLILLEHEYAELSFMKDGMTQHEAHKKAEELYNYSRALKERK